ncbi:MAG: YgiQ family radical SAM protein, partial [Bacteroidales bacterium]|nr:YgiQ family radical SAM protein [Bacteroidales bacterium]
MTKLFLPTSQKEIKALAWDYIDVILFSGDAYVDHPAFGIAVIARVLQNEGYRVAVVPQPNWQDDLRDFKKLGKPRLFFGVSAGNMDSMVNHYTANKRLRSDDAYTADGRAGARPDYATIVYSNILKEIYPDTPVVIGGVEASMRRFTHYDYWKNKVLPSIIVSSKADFLIYGMAEKSIAMLTESLSKNIDYKHIPQLVYRSDMPENQIDNSIVLNSYQDCLKDKKKYAENFKIIETESNKMYGKVLVQNNENETIVANPMFATISSDDLDAVHALPFTRLPHPRYKKKAQIPAYEMIKNSINIHRGCFGGCSFCTISAHQGKFVSSRSEKSIMQELE